MNGSVSVRQMAGKARSKRELRRKKPIYAPKECTLIVCEGAATEPNYFDGFWRRLRIPWSLVDVEVVGEGAVPLTVVGRADSRRKQRQKEAGRSQVVEYDRVWCVVDVEAPRPHEKLSEALCKARDLRIDVALSNPCFEFWLLLHFEYTGKYFTGKTVCRALKRHIPDYSKGQNIINAVYDLTEDAIRNAELIIRAQHHDPDDLTECNPSTHVHLLVKHLQKMASRQ